MRALRFLQVLPVLIVVVGLGAAGGARAQPVAAPTVESGSSLHIVWEVKNRFRLFRQERDFQLHAAALAGRSVLAAEQLMALESEGRGWARNMLGRLCIDAVGHIPDQCERDGAKESYLTPSDHRVSVRLAGPVSAESSCAWSFDDGQGPPQTTSQPCSEPVTLRVRRGVTTVATLETSGSDGGPVRLSADIAV